MKQLIQFSLLSNLLLSTTAFAVNPVQGFYVGILADISRGPSSTPVTFSFDNNAQRFIYLGNVSYSVVGGGGGATFGYRYSHFRIEGEALYNRISTGPLKVGSCTLQSATTALLSGDCRGTGFEGIVNTDLAYNGSSNVIYGMVNAYWDFFSYDSERRAVPYVGVGIGQARIKNSSNFTNIANFPNPTFGEKIQTNTGAFQGIIGASYFMDDYTAAGMDFRYTSTSSIPVLGNKRYNLISLNFSVNFAFDKGGIDC